MIIGTHAILYSKNAAADRAFLRDVLKFQSVDAGDGWLIFNLPPSELAVHPSDTATDRHELYLMCDDVRAVVAAMNEYKVPCSPITEQPWGLLVRIVLPGGGTLGIYQPRHARPHADAVHHQ